MRLGEMTLSSEAQCTAYTRTATLTLGTVTASWSSLASGHKIFLTPQESGTLNGSVRVTARTNGVGFTMTLMKHCNLISDDRVIQQIRFTT